LQGGTGGPFDHEHFCTDALGHFKRGRLGGSWVMDFAVFRAGVISGKLDECVGH